MARYLTGRVLQGVVVLWAAFTVAFFVLYILPSDPASIVLGGGGDAALVSEDDMRAVRAEMGLDQPVVAQYGERLADFLRGDWGTSFETRQPVAEAILTAIPETFKLTGLALMLSVLLGGTVAIASVLTKSSTLEQLLLSLPPVGISIPTFWSGLVLMQFFSFGTGWFPAMGNDGLKSLVLPALTLSLPTSAAFAQVLAKSLRRTLQEPFVDVVRAKGSTHRELVIRHALRNSIIPALTILAVTVGNLVAGAVVVETVFSRAGLGRLTQTAVISQDIPLMLGIVVVSAAIFVAVNLIVDLLYPVIDPRIRVHAKAAR